MTNEPMPETDWRSIYIASFIAFCAAVQFGLYFASLWPYLQTIDNEVTEQFLGFIVAAYSIATCIAAPIFGFWSNKIRQVALPMTTGILSMFTGNLIYLSCELLPSHRRYALFVGRFLTGIGSANIPLLRAYASTACNPEDRPRAMSFLTGGITLGLVIGPAIQGLFTSIGYPGFVIFPNFSISMYTASAYGACVMNALSLICLKYFFVEKYSGIHKENVQETEDTVKVPKFDRIAAFICNFTRFAQQFIFTNIEFISSPYAMAMFAFTRHDTVQYGSIAQTGMGLMGVVIFAAFILCKLNKRVKYRIGTIVAFVSMLIFHLLTYPWPFLSGQLQIYSEKGMLNSSDEQVGCNIDHIQWCESTSPVNPWLYYISFVIFFGLGYPVIDLCNNTVYGRVLGPRRQGFMQGILQVSSGIARIVGPLSIGVIYSTYGPKLIWIVEIVVIVVTILLWIVFYRRLVTLQVVSVKEASALISKGSEKCEIMLENEESRDGA
ncbi:hypothetical protein QR680_003935 [Steinernema hermaphroditum]|uniref:Major facilitator superfamily (MFS) profile domain-containing protein n=1 Tax=Steinernema hermaphroditum TaxID=289476 RepID=A0AA39HN64_9BILA|nr:hypothetical protein QR680_003935 [Steinernema hermaphroditum]